MAINEKDFLTFAKSLPDNTEINCRNIISRAYYSAYHACCSVYTPNFDVDGGVHQKLISSLTKSPSKQDKINGYILNQLKFLRVQSDYYMDKNITKSDAGTALSQTEKLQSNLAIETPCP
jgi:uncharacterized protein (UPF0332 family)